MRAFSLTILLFFTILLPARAGELDRYMQSKGMIDVSKMDTTLRVELKYAEADNIFGAAVYTGITGAWLHPDAAKKLLRAQQLLKAAHPSYTLIIYDAARPMAVQRRMWNLVRGTSKTNYVSNPAKGGGLHNYGMAVDATILDTSTGQPLPMGSPFDHFGETAHTNNEETLLEEGKITHREFDNRRLLRSVMRRAGFRTILYEWWHFNACSRETAKKYYTLIE